MKRLFSLMIPLWLLLSACSDKNDVYYTIDYPITQIDVTLSIQDVASSSDIFVRIEEQIRSMALLDEGGYYGLDFSVYNGGSLRLVQQDGTIGYGTFLKDPDKLQIEFIAGEKTATATMSAYLRDLKDSTTQEGEQNKTERCMKFKFDVKEQIQALYPELVIEEASRTELSSQLFLY